jgi:hypothetical protein
MVVSWLYRPGLISWSPLEVKGTRLTCAGLQLSCLTSYRRAEKPKMVSTPTPGPIYGLRPRIRGWSVISTEPGLYLHLYKGWSMYLKGAGGGLAQVALMGGGGRPTLLVSWSPASKERGSGNACTTSMVRVDPGSSFMLYLGPGPPSLLFLTRANETLPYAGDTHIMRTMPPGKHKTRDITTPRCFIFCTRPWGICYVPACIGKQTPEPKLTTQDHRFEANF